MAKRKWMLLVMTFLLTSLLLGVAAWASPDQAVVDAASAAVADTASDGMPGADSGTPWWVWPIGLFVFTFVLGIVAVLGGVGGGVLYVPIVSGFFPFHLDFVRSTGLLVALATALSAGPGLLKKNLASLRLSMPMAVLASSSAIGGAMVGLALPTNVIQSLLGGTIIFIVLIMLLAKKSDYPNVPKADSLSAALGMTGIYYEESLGKNVEWKTHRTPQAIGLFLLIGFMAGMFGLGAGWANVPVLNLVMGAPLKVSVASSVFLLSITDTSAAWVFINKGAVLPLMVAPSVLGVMFGSKIGVKILARVKPKAIKWLVIGLLLLSGLRSLLKGLGIWA